MDFIYRSQITYRKVVTEQNVPIKNEQEKTKLITRKGNIKNHSYFIMPTVCELRIQAKAKGITGFSQMRKSQLEAALKAPITKIKATVKKPKAKSSPPKSSPPKSSPPKSSPPKSSPKSAKIAELEKQLRLPIFNKSSIDAIKTPTQFKSVRDRWNKIAEGLEDNGVDTFEHTLLMTIQANLQARENKGTSSKSEKVRIAWDNMARG